MSLTRPILPRITPPSGFSFSDEDVAKRRNLRRRAVHTQQIPLFRLAGLLLLTLMVWMFQLSGHSASPDGYLLLDPALFTFLIALYCLTSWYTLRRWYDPDSRFDLPMFWQLADHLPVLLFLFTVDGLDRWISLLLAITAADHTDEGPNRTLVFVTSSLLLYLVCTALVDTFLIPLDYDRVVLVSAGLFCAGLYATMRSRTSRYLRDRTRTAVRAARSLVRRLEDRGQLLEQQTAELRAAHERAEQANLSKNHFLANVSHEIRTPLNGVVGTIDILFDSKLDAHQIEMLRTLRTSAQSLLSLLNDILDLTKIEAGKLQTERIEFSVRDLVQDVVALAGTTAAKKQLRLEALIDEQVPDRVAGDPARLRQILTNLLSNSLKFTDRGHIEVAVSRSVASSRSSSLETKSAGGVDLPGDPVGLRFEVRDSGIGIASSKLDEVFEAFVQADDSTTRRYGGTGLGLPICRQLVQLMGGSMGADSQPGEGSTFWFEIPFRTVRAGRTRDTTGSLPLRSRRVVSLQCPASENLSERFKPWGVSITIVDDLAAMLERISNGNRKARPYELALLTIGRRDQQRLAKASADVERLCSSVPVAVLFDDPMSPALADLLRRAGVAAILRADRADYEIAYALRLLLEAEGSGIELLDDDELSRRLPRHRVLLAEDNPVNRLVATRHLEKGGYEVVVAEDGDQAVQRFAEHSFDIVLMDLQMPNVDGYEAASRIRALERGNEVPIVAVTAHALKGDREAILARGLDDYLAKPISRAKLFEVIERNVSAPRGIHSLFQSRQES